MSASACVAFFGLRFEIASDEIDKLELRTDARLTAAKSVGLSTYWGNFGGETGRYVLLVGTKLAVLGAENEAALALPAGRLSDIIARTEERLRSAQFVGDIGLYLEWLEDA